MSVDPQKLSALRRVIQENLRVQIGSGRIEYVDVGDALNDALARQNHAIFARRGCGKTLLLHKSSENAPEEIKIVYLNCEDFKQHSFPNVLIEILASLFREMEKHQTGWFGRKKNIKEGLNSIISDLDQMTKEADQRSEIVRERSAQEAQISTGAKGELSASGAAIGASIESQRATSSEIEKSYELHHEKLQRLDTWLPRLKERIRIFFEQSKKVKTIFIQIDDLYHLRKSDQAFVVDYIHRLCKDLPLFFKIATLRHASTLYADREGQPIGAQERHDYQPISIDYSFGDFSRTERQNRQILYRFAEKADMTREELDSLFKGEGFARLVMAGGGVPRDILSLFLEILNDVGAKDGGKIGKDEVRILSKANFERRIEELKHDSRYDEQNDLIRGIYTIWRFCLDKKTNIFLIEERMLKEDDAWRALFYRLLDYRIVHNCANALTHKSQEGTYQAFAIDIGCYAHLRKHMNRFNEIDVSDKLAKEKMRSAPILTATSLASLYSSAPADVESELLADEIVG